MGADFEGGNPRTKMVEKQRTQAQINSGKMNQKRAENPRPSETFDWDSALKRFDKILKDYGYD